MHGWNAQLFREDLGIRCFVALPLGFSSKASDCLPRWMDSDLSAIKHLDAEDIEIFGRTCPNNFSEAGYTNTHQLTSGTFLCLLLAQFLVAHHIHCFTQRWGIITRVVLPTQCGAVGELIFLNEVLKPKICRIPSQLLGKHIRNSLNCVHSFRHSERTTIGDSSWWLVCVNRVHLSEGRWNIVRTRYDREEP